MIDSDLSRSLPPLGVQPRFLWVEHRVDELWQAIMRAVKAGILPQQEWLDEMKEHEHWLQQRQLMNRLAEAFNPGETGEVQYVRRGPDTDWHVVVENKRIDNHTHDTPLHGGDSSSASASSPSSPDSDSDEDSRGDF